MQNQANLETSKNQAEHKTKHSAFTYKGTYNRTRTSTPRHKARSLKYSLFTLMVPIVSIWCVVGILSYFKIDELSLRSGALTKEAIPSVESSDRIQRDMVKIAYHVDLIAQSSNVSVAYFNYISLVNLIRASSLYHIPEIHEELAVMRNNLDKMYEAKKELHQKTKDIVNAWFLYYSAVQNYYILSGQIRLLDEISTHDHSGLIQGYGALDNLVRSHIKPFYNHVGAQCELILNYYNQHPKDYNGDQNLLSTALLSLDTTNNELVGHKIIGEQLNNKFVDRPETYSAYKVDSVNKSDLAKTASGVDIALAVPSRYLDLPSNKTNQEILAAKEKILDSKNAPLNQNVEHSVLANAHDYKQDYGIRRVPFDNDVKEEKEHYLRNEDKLDVIQNKAEAFNANLQQMAKHEQELNNDNNKYGQNNVRSNYQDLSLDGDVGIDKAAIAAEEAAFKSKQQDEQDSSESLAQKLNRAVDNLGTQARNESNNNFQYAEDDSFIYNAQTKPNLEQERQFLQNATTKSEDKALNIEHEVNSEHDYLKAMNDDKNSKADGKKIDFDNHLLKLLEQNKDALASPNENNELSFIPQAAKVVFGEDEIKKETVNLTQGQENNKINTDTHKDSEHFLLTQKNLGDMHKLQVNSKGSLLKALDIEDHTQDDKYVFTCSLYTKTANELYYALNAQKVSMDKFNRVYSDLLAVIATINNKAIAIARTPISAIAIEVEESAKKVYILAVIAILASIASVFYIYRSINKYFCDPVQRLVEVINEFNITYRIPDPRENPMKECQDVILSMRPVFENYRRIMQQNGDLNNIDTMVGQVYYFDGITHLHNRNALDEIASKSPDLPFNSAVILVDIDNFRSINELSGENAGDDALSLIARCLKANISHDHDMIFRYDDDEFCIILNKTTYEHALNTCKQLVQQIANLKIRYRAYTRSFTVTVGMSYICDDADVVTTNFVEHIAYAHEALNCGKRNGGNQVQVFKEFKSYKDQKLQEPLNNQHTYAHSNLEQEAQDMNFKDYKEQELDVSTQGANLNTNIDFIDVKDEKEQNQNEVDYSLKLKHHTYIDDNNKDNNEDEYLGIDQYQEQNKMEHIAHNLVASNINSYVSDDSTSGYAMHEDREIRLKALRDRFNISEHTTKNENDNVIINYGDENIDLSKEQHVAIEPSKWANSSRRFNRFTHNDSKSDFSLEKNDEEQQEDNTLNS